MVPAGQHYPSGVDAASLFYRGVWAVLVRYFERVRCWGGAELRCAQGIHQGAPLHR